MRKFLTAEWRDLIMANYEVDPSLLNEYIPSGTDLDLYEGRCFVSIVGFMFIDTRVLGFLIPFHINFEEVNLRFYVRRTLESEVRQAVTFIREIVPLHAVTFVARTVYGEPYETWQMRNRRDNGRVEYDWSKGGVQNRLAVSVGKDLGIPSPESLEHFIIEHYWGYTRRSETRTDEYLVEHPPWALHEAGDAEISVDFGRTYGDRFAFLTDSKPYSVLFTTGSEIVVYQGKSIN
jgi:uncharacterized protein YqjF (DUF2071 family)